MPDTESSIPNVPGARAVPKKRTRLSFVWIVPIVAAAAGVWIAVTAILNKGPEITIIFQSAEGLEANKTRIEYNGLTVGTLTSLQLMPDHQRVIAKAAMNPKTEQFLVKDTLFWVVKPRVSGLNVTGLGTLLSGHYIGVQLGKSKESEHAYTALETPPRAANIAGRVFTLKTRELGSLGAGTPIYFRQLPAGEVLSYELDKAGESLDVKIFVQSPYDQYVKPDTRFWQASGVDLSLTASGLHVQTESVMSILAGGIAFETIASESPLPPAAAGAVFTLFDGRADAFKPNAIDPQTYLLVFKQSVRGLTVGAPVTVGGITIGEVTQINPQFDMQTMDFTVPVIISLDPARYGVKFLETAVGENGVPPHKLIMNSLVSRGLRAQLKTGNLLSGALFIAIDIVPDAAPATLDWAQSPVQLPTVSSKIEAIEDSVASLLKNLDKTVTTTHDTLANVDILVKNLDKTVTTTRGTLTNADALINNASTLIAPDSPLNAGLVNMLEQSGGAARSLRALADYLERHPEALIHGKTGEAQP